MVGDYIAWLTRYEALDILTPRCRTFALLKRQIMTVGDQPGRFCISRLFSILSVSHEAECGTLRFYLYSHFKFKV